MLHVETCRNAIPVAPVSNRLGGLAEYARCSRQPAQGLDQLRDVGDFGVRHEMEYTRSVCS